MRRLARVILNVLTALSLLLCVAACVLWARSYAITDTINTPIVSRYVAYSHEGDFYLWDNVTRNYLFRGYGHFSFVVLTLSLPTLRLLPILKQARHERERRARYNLCVRCGYDLRATPTRCPECGTTAGTYS
jgi:hypothetical protein